MGHPICATASIFPSAPLPDKVVYVQADVVNSSVCPSTPVTILEQLR